MKKVLILGNIVLTVQREGKNMSDKNYGEWEAAPVVTSEWEDVRKTSDTIPSPVITKAPMAAPSTDLLSKAAQVVSGGKFGTMQDLIYGGQRPADSMLSRAGQIVDTSGLTGLTGISKVADVPVLATSIGKNIPNISPFVKKASQVAKPATDVIKELPAQALSFMSGKDKEAFKYAYNIARQAEPTAKELAKKFEIGLDLQKKYGSQMNYNYSRVLGLPHDIAITATSYDKTSPQGAWSLWSKYIADNPSIPPAYIPFKNASVADKIRMAEQSGVDLGRWSPIAGKTGEALSRSDLVDMAKWAIPALPYAIPTGLLKSPRVAGLVATGAGKAANVASKGKDILRAGYGEISPAVSQYYQQLAGLLSTQDQ
jgi:hypothetical protein